MKLAFTVLSISLVAASQASQVMASPVAAPTLSSASDIAIPLPPLTNDLILATHTNTLASSSVGGTFSSYMGSNPSFLNDGSLGNSVSVDPNPDTTGFSISTPYSVTYDLNLNPGTGGHSLGYNISSIESFAGWQSTFIGQDYTVTYTTVGSATPVTLGTFTLSPGGALSSLMTITDNSNPYLAVNVDSITFSIANEVGGATDVYREIVVAGTFATPEPSSILMAGIAAVGLFCCSSNLRKGNRIKNRAVIILLVLSLTACATSGLMAMPIATPALNATSEVAYPVSSTDLINQGQATLASPPIIGGTFTPYSPTSMAPFSSPNNLTDGTAGTPGDVSTTAFSAGTAYTATYDLNLNPGTGGSALGYNILDIQSFVGWSGVGRFSQDVTISYTTISAPTPVSLGTFTLDGSSLDGGVGSTRMTVADNSSPFLASHVASITFGLDGTNVYREIDVNGSFSTPEPSSMVLAVVGMMGLGLAVRFRQRRKANVA